MLVQDLGKFQKIAGCVLLDCIAMSNFNLSKKFRTFNFRVWIFSLQISSFIRVSQTQIIENTGKINV